MKDNYKAHIPVMIEEVLKYLSPKNGERYLDCTFGAGGYSEAILSSADCSLTACDRDPSTKIYAAPLEKNFKEKFEFIETKFSSIEEKTQGRKFDGIAMDLGVSSMQLDNYERGFAFSGNGFLDMRMSGEGPSASDFINGASESEIADVIYKYGEETSSRKIARNIVAQRKKEPILDTLRLASIVRDSIGFRKGKIDPATKTFQAIRIYINDEMRELELFLDSLKNLLALGGRIAIVSFHSLEDSIVKNFFKENAAKKVAVSKYSKNPEIPQEGKWLKISTPKPIFPSSEEIFRNPRSRSARLRSCVRIGE